MKEFFAAAAASFLALTACDGMAGRDAATNKGGEAEAAPAEDKLTILELQIEELRTELAAEKKTREEMNKELAAAIDEVEAAVRANAGTAVPAPLPEAAKSKQ